MRIFSRHIPGPGDPLLILHGLFGSSRNWLSHARELSRQFDVHLIDHRNHGESPWSNDHSLRFLIEDSMEYQRTEIGRPAIWLGHSLGGLVAMGAALFHPGAVKALIVVDIAPRDYPPHHDREFAALRIDVSRMQTRQEVDAAMEKIHPDREVRQFLQMNLERQGDGFRWKCNVDALEGTEFLRETNRFYGLTQEGLTLEGLMYAGPALFVAGDRSDYIRPEDHPAIRRFFPRAEIRTIEGDHWLHHTNYRGFMDEVREFLQTPRTT